MKMFTTAFALLVVATGLAAAQDMSNVAERNAPTTSAPATARDVTGFYAPNSAPALSTESTKNPPNPHPDLRPRAGGVFVDGVKYGTVMISPTAPAEYGMGEKYLSAPSASYDTQHESGPAAHRTSGGLKLFSFEF
jgi:hypothetical protein